MCSSGIFPLPGCVHPVHPHGIHLENWFCPMGLGGRKEDLPFSTFSISTAQPLPGWEGAQPGSDNLEAQPSAVFSFHYFSLPFPQPSGCAHLWAPSCAGLGGRGGKGPPVPSRKGKTQAQLEPCLGLTPAR